MKEHCIPLKEMTKELDLEIHPTTSFRFGKNITIEDGVIIDSNCYLWASENSKIVTWRKHKYWTKCNNNFIQS